MGEEIEHILRHPLFRENMERCAVYERDRKFCRHDMAHALAVARICYILVLEQKLAYRKELVYAAALLHDIGRAEQYAAGLSHRAAGARIAGTILADSGFSTEEIGLIKAVIESHCSHRSGEQECGGREPEDLFEAFGLADFWSRSCRECMARSECYWDIKSDVLKR